eukprot:TRINITY_DN873_c0_g1_i1.p1 TRINITY_DN873_c0_g1~~TRINITY_DN873_c0_g1_i1.p1  ORF type:complete len:363 (+),score=80.93 TRINITY_DN873_c0_g1_i1:190-1278(+)
MSPKRGQRGKGSREQRRNYVQNQVQHVDNEENHNISQVATRWRARDVPKSNRQRQIQHHESDWDNNSSHVATRHTYPQRNNQQRQSQHVGSEENNPSCHAARRSRGRDVPKSNRQRQIQDHESDWDSNSSHVATRHVHPQRNNQQRQSQHVGSKENNLPSHAARRSRHRHQRNKQVQLTDVGENNNSSQWRRSRHIHAYRNLPQDPYLLGGYYEDETLVEDINNYDLQLALTLSLSSEGRTHTGSSSDNTNGNITGFSYESLVELEDVKCVASEHFVDSLPTYVFDEKRIEQGASDMSGKCAICLEEYEFGDHIIYVPCAHCFHHVCGCEWFLNHSKRCPICNNDVTVDMAVLRKFESLAVT